jgi:hypothetical protein
MPRLVLALVTALTLVAAPSAIAQDPPPQPQLPGTDVQLPSNVDSDGDRVPDTADRCPTVPGSITDGCPSPDRDNDGIPNESDPCPEIPNAGRDCPQPPPAGGNAPAHDVATQLGRPSAAIKEYSRGLQLTGGISANGYMKPKRLTIWLPKGITVSSAPTKPCSQAFAKTLQLNGFMRCAKMFAGRLGSEEHSGYFAFAGPKVGARQRLFLRARSQDGEDGEEIVGFGTGWIDPAKGAFGPKLTLELGQLGLDVRMVELYSAPENGVKPLRGKCTGKFRVRLETPQGNTDKTFRC